MSEQWTIQLLDEQNQPIEARGSASGSTALIGGGYMITVTGVERVAKNGKPGEFNTKYTVQVDASEGRFKGAKRTVNVPDPSPSMSADSQKFCRGRAVNVLVSCGLLTEEQVATGSQPAVAVNAASFIGKKGYIMVGFREDNRPEHKGTMRENVDFCKKDEYLERRAVDLEANGIVETAATAVPKSRGTSGSSLGSPVAPALGAAVAPAAAAAGGLQPGLNPAAAAPTPVAPPAAAQAPNGIAAPAPSAGLNTLLGS